MESILLRGEGRTGSLQVGNREPGSSLTPIILKMNDKYHEFCSSK